MISDTAFDWVRTYVRKSNKEFGMSSYGLKHLCERDTGEYVSNDDFKEVMIKAGHEPINPTEMNHRYKVKLLDK